MTKKMIVMSVCSLSIISALIFGGCEKKDNLASNSKEKIERLQTKEQKENSIGIELYFDGSKDGKTSELSKEDRILNSDEVLGEVILQELIKGPTVKSNLKPVIPKDTRLISFTIRDKIATINFSNKILVTMTPEKEETCLKAIASSLTQLPSVEKVKIQVENKNIDTLGGNFDISETFNKNEVNLKKISK